MILSDIDKKILIYMDSVKVPVCGRKISYYAGVTPPSVGIKLNRLLSKGIVKKHFVGKNRVFYNNSKKVVSPTKILWCLDLFEESHEDKLLCSVNGLRKRCVDIRSDIRFGKSDLISKKYILKNVRRDFYFAKRDYDEFKNSKFDIDVAIQ